MKRAGGWGQVSTFKGDFQGVRHHDLLGFKFQDFKGSDTMNHQDFKGSDPMIAQPRIEHAFGRRLERMVNAHTLGTVGHSPWGCGKLLQADGAPSRYEMQGRRR